MNSGNHPINFRLAPDMFTLLGQAQMATAFAKNAVCRLAGHTPPDFPDIETSEADVLARIDRARGIVLSVIEEVLAGAEQSEISIQTGPSVRSTVTDQAHLLGLSMPQYCFHASMAYAIPRHNGVPPGKRDF